MSDKQSSQSRLAVLIDADNTTPAIAAALLAEIAKYGVASVKRIYGDWTQPNLKGWKDVLITLAIQPIQQFGYTSGKNATDSAMIIDAMDLLYTQRLDGFCLVSSDSDFTRLASRLRESGMDVYGFGERKTPRAFIGACDKFIYVDILREPAKAAVDSAAEEASAKPKPGRRKPKAAAVEAEPAPVASSVNDPANDLAGLLAAAVEACADESGWAHLGAMGQYVSKQRPDFDSRSYGKKRLSDLVKSVDGFVVEARPAGDGKGSALYVHRQ